MGSSYPRSTPPLSLRVGDDDRQRVVAELQQHFVAGRLTSEELGERVSQALDARTFGDLAAVMADLPELPDPALAHIRDRRPPEQPMLFGVPVRLLAIAFGLVMLLLLFVAAPMWGVGHLGGMSPFGLLFMSFFFFGGPRGGGRHRHF